MASPQMEGLKALMKQMMAGDGMPRFTGDFDPIKLRAVIEESQARMPLLQGVSIQSLTLGGIEAEKCIPEQIESKAVVCYIHGGGLICGNARTSRGYGCVLATECKCPVYTLSYRLAPENPFPAAVEDCINAYKGIVDLHPDQPIFLTGESGGAHLTLTTVIQAIKAGIRLPAGVILNSPVADMSGLIDHSKYDSADFTVSDRGLKELANLYAPGRDLTNELISPVYASYEGFPPMLLTWDESETLAPDSEAVANKARTAGVYVECVSYPDCFHAFATTGRGTPESSEILDRTLEFIRKFT